MKTHLGAPVQKRGTNMGALLAKKEKVKIFNVEVMSGGFVEIVSQSMKTLLVRHKNKMFSKTAD